MTFNISSNFINTLLNTWPNVSYALFHLNITTTLKKIIQAPLQVMLVMGSNKNLLPPQHFSSSNIKIGKHHT